jgi:acetyl esterase/lipase
MRLLLVVICGFIIWRSADRSAVSDEFQKQSDIVFAKVDEQVLQLDLYSPRPASRSAEQAPRLIVWVHGGAWRAGSKTDMPLKELLSDGYAVASVDYRLSTAAKFPAQVHDIKAAIRFLRARQADYGFDARHITIAGSSAGGHLAALVGVSNGVRELEGTVGDHLTTSSDVQVIIDLFGPTNLETILPQSTPHGLNVRVPALQLLLGGQPKEVPELARLASPVSHVDAKDPPLLMIHGDQDPQVPINQSHELEGRYRTVGRPVQFEVVHGGAHGGAAFFDADRLAVIRAFLKKHR